VRTSIPVVSRTRRAATPESSMPRHSAPPALHRDQELSQAAAVVEDARAPAPEARVAREEDPRVGLVDEGRRRVAPFGQPVPRGALLAVEVLVIDREEFTRLELRVGEERAARPAPAEDVSCALAGDRRVLD
jgi:hypothetical protein